MSAIMSAGVLQKALVEEGFRIETDQIEQLSASLRQRLQSWLEGDRVFPRFLTPFYRDEVVSITSLTDDEEWTEQSLGEEVADTLTLLGLTVQSPESAFSTITDYDQNEVEEAGHWTLSVHLESARAAEENRDPAYVPCPACVDRLLAPVATEDSDDTPIQAAEAAGEIPQPIPAAPGVAETREQAISRLQTGLHEVRQKYIERRDHYEAAAETAKAAKKSMDSAQETLNDLVGELDDAINSEVWQARLPLKYDGEAPTEVVGVAAPANADDPAKSSSIEQLVEFGISQKQAEKLMDADIETVAELEKRIREVNGWFRKIKGIGESAADKVSDALIEWRKKHGYGE